MNDLKRCVGINLTSSKLQFVEIEKDNSYLEVENLGQTFFSPPLIFEEQGENVLIEQLQAAFDEIKIRNPIRSNIASFTLPPELFITLQLPFDPNLNQYEIKEEFNWELSQLFPFTPVEDLAIKFYELDSSFLPGRHNALIVGLDKKFLLLIKIFCQKNNLTPKLVDNASITANSFINNYYNEKRKATIHIFNSRNAITLFINLASKPAYVKDFPKEKNDYISTIVGEISNINFKDLINPAFKSAILSGEDLGGDLLSEIGRGTGLVFEYFNPFEIAKFNSNLHNNEVSSDQFSSFISAVGIASRFS